MIIFFFTFEKFLHLDAGKYSNMAGVFEDGSGEIGEKISIIGMIFCLYPLISICISYTVMKTWGVINDYLMYFLETLQTPKMLCDHFDIEHFTIDCT